MRASSRALAWVGAVVLLLAALVATTSDGPAWLGVDEGPGVESSNPSTTDETSPSGDSGDARADPPQDSADDGPSLATRTTALAILLLAGAAALVGVLVGTRFMLRRRRLDGTVRPRSVTGTRDSPDAEPPAELVDAASSGLRSLTEGSPRNAIVATWIRLEEATVAAGFEQRAAETPTEFVRRAISCYPVDDLALHHLADLYREARFSRHRLTEEHRDAALRCLHRLHRQLARVDVR